MSFRHLLTERTQRMKEKPTQEFSEFVESNHIEAEPLSSPFPSVFMENDAVKRPYLLLPLPPYRAVTGRTFSVKSYQRKSKFGAGSLQNISCSVVGIFGVWGSHSSACLGRKHYQICGRLSLGKASCWEKRVPNLSELTVQLIKGCL